MTRQWQTALSWLIGGLFFVGIFFFGLSYYIDIQSPDVSGVPVLDADGSRDTVPEMDKMNILVLGIDSRNDDFRGRTDTIIVASVDPNNGKINMVSIPRDTRVKIKGSWDKVNAAYVYGGVELAREVVEDLLDINIDNYAVIDFKGFVRLVDIVGGIEVDVPVNMYYPPEGINLKKGRQKLDGEDALAYSRFRGTVEGDIGRARRQQQVIKLLLDELLQAKNILKAPQLIDTVRENVETDISVAAMAKLVKIAQHLDSTTVNAIVLEGTSKKIDGLWYYLPSEASLEEASKLLS
ncbi:MAG: LCP family protein [Thermoanaerobacteraceae bacterium]|nr:LCP family protein [Thermoanaerobacteraceae bacterium]